MTSPNIKPADFAVPVGEEAVDRGFAVGVGGQLWRPGGFEPGVSHELGDQDDVMAFADQPDAEGVAQDVAAGDVGSPLGAKAS